MLLPPSGSQYIIYNKPTLTLHLKGVVFHMEIYRKCYYYFSAVFIEINDFFYYHTGICCLQKKMIGNMISDENLLSITPVSRITRY